MPRTLKLVIAYDGTNYAGWQRQTNGLGIQQVLEDEIAAIVGAHHPLNAAGRTDAGVHAAAQVASITLDHPIPCDELQRALNARLKAGDIRIRAIEEMPDRWDARIFAKSKTYRYAIWNGAAPSPFFRHVVWHVPQPLDLDRMVARDGGAPRRARFRRVPGPRQRRQDDGQAMLAAEMRGDESPHRSADRAVAARRTRPMAADGCFASRSPAPVSCVTWCGPSSARSSTSAAVNSRSKTWRRLSRRAIGAGPGIPRRRTG